MSQPIFRIDPSPVRSRAVTVWLAVVLAGCAAPHKLPALVPTTQTTETARPVLRDPAGPVAKGDQSALPGAAAPQPRPDVPLPAPMQRTTLPDTAELPAATDAASIAPTPGKGRPFAKGKASWYGPRFHGRRTASGERYDMHAFTAAHRTLPFGTRLRVRSVHTGQEVVVRINDRGPFKHQRIIDLSRAAMVALGTLERGVTEVELLRE